MLSVGTIVVRLGLCDRVDTAGRDWAFREPRRHSRIFLAAMNLAPSEDEDVQRLTEESLGLACRIKFAAAGRRPCRLDWLRSGAFVVPRCISTPQESEASVGVLPHTRSAVVRLRRVARCELGAIVVCRLRRAGPDMIRLAHWPRRRVSRESVPRALGHQFLVWTCTSALFFVGTTAASMVLGMAQVVPGRARP